MYYAIIKGDGTLCLQYPMKKSTHSFIKLTSHLQNSFEFNIVFKSPYRFTRDFMTIYGLDLCDFCLKLSNKKRYIRHIDSKVLLGFSINRKVAKAHKRNLIKRRIKAIMCNLVSQGEISHTAFIFVCRRNIIELSFHDLEKHIRYAVKKITLYSQSNK